jgi:hypothetical protein
MPAERDAQHLVYKILYRPRPPNDPLPAPDTSATTRRLWATAGRIIEALAAESWVPLRQVHGYEVDGVGVVHPTEVRLVMRAARGDNHA